MFTGITEATANVIECTDTGITVSRPVNFGNIQIGQSIAVNGACLTVIAFDDHMMRFSVVPETFRRTNLKTARQVNLERALKSDGRFEGHIVLGHVDATTSLLSRVPEGEGERFSFQLPESLAPFFVEKGSVCLNGISLTIAAIDKTAFSIAIIPHTLKETNFGILEPGDDVNVEADYFAKLLYKWNKGELDSGFKIQDSGI